MREIVSPLDGFGSPFGTRRRVTPGPTLDPDAAAYIAAVETADTQALEPAVQTAINDFVVGCKADNIWDAIKASCIMAGARTLAGALVPLVGPAPTNNNFVSADYNRVTGLKGDGSTKYLDSNRANNADPQDDQHIAVNGTSDATSFPTFFAGAGGTTAGRSVLFRSNVDLVFASQSFTNSGQLSGSGLGGSFMGISRSVSTGFFVRANGNNYSVTQVSQTPTTDSIFVFCRNNASGTPESFVDNRLSFYSIGESLDLAALDARVSALMTAIDGALP